MSARAGGGGLRTVWNGAVVLFKLDSFSSRLPLLRRLLPVESVCWCPSVSTNRAWTLTRPESLRVLRFFPASFSSRCASRSARSFSMPLSSYHWLYSLRVSDADASLKARILSTCWACRCPLELMWVKRWDISEKFCFFGQAVQVSGMELSGLTEAMFGVCACPGEISTARLRHEPGCQRSGKPGKGPNECRKLVESERRLLQSNERICHPS